MMKLRWTTTALLPGLICLTGAGEPGIGKETAGAGTTARPVSLQLHAQSSGEEKSSQPIRLRGADARQQLLATAKFSAGALRDYTRQVSYQISPAHVAHINKNGLITPLADGAATITAKSSEGLTASIPVMVEKFNVTTPINFANQIVPIFTKTGCNAGGC